MKISIRNGQWPIDPRQTFLALRHRNYRLWFFGQMFSLMGIWMQNTAQGYLMFELTKSTDNIF